MRAATTILVVSEQHSDFERCRELLADAPVRLEHCAAPARAGRRIRAAHFDLILLGAGGAPPETLLRESWLRDLDPLDPPVLVLRDHCDGQSLPWEQLALARLDGHQLLLHIDQCLERHARALRLLKLAQCDPLTGLAGRPRFQQHLQDTLARARRTGTCCALLRMEVRDLSPQGTEFEPDVTDELLIAVAERLANSVRTTDLVARLGGAEFAILATQLHAPEDAVTLARSVLRACYFDDAGPGHRQLGTGIGVAVFPADGDGAQALDAAAGGALRRAMAQGGGNFCCADENMEAAARTGQELRDDIGHALLRGEMELRFQPQIDLRRGGLPRVEVLLRWQHPHWGLLAPEYFLAAAEADGVIHALGSWVVHRACEQQLEWRRQGLPALPLAVNASAGQLHRDTLATALREMAGAGFAAAELGLEFDETVLAQCSEQSRDLLTDLHAAGFPLAVDGFRGSCPLAQLRRVPFDTVKLARRLVDRVTRDRDSAGLAEDLIRLGHALRCDTVATGVERGDVADFLLRRRCDRMQGFYIARPLTAAELPRWLRRLQRGRSADQPSP